MKTILISLIIFASFASALGQNIERNLEEFNELEIKNALMVNLIQGNENKVIITGVNEEDADKLITEIKDNKLFIHTNGRIKKNDEIIIQLTFKELKGIRQSGASELNSTGTIKATNFYVIGSGAIGAKLDLNVTNLTIDFSGASDITLSGNTENFNVTLSGASDLKASKLMAKHVNIDVSGASSLKVYASESIKGNAKGASSIYIKGNPAVKAINGTNSTSSTYIGENVSISMGKSGVDVNNDEVNVKAGSTAVNVKNDTTIVKWGHSEMILIGDSVYIKKDKKKRRNHWAGVDLGINGFMTSGGSFDLSNPAHFEQTNPEKVTQFMELNLRKSWTVSINFFEKFIKIKEHHFGLVTGMGTEWNNYELEHNVRLTPKGGGYVYNPVNAYNENYTWGVIDSTLDYSKNRFKTWFVNVPLMLEINTGHEKNKSFHLSAGAIFGMNLQTKMKYKYNLNGDSKKEKDKDSFNTNTFRTSLTARVGYGWFTMFATYSLTPLFENGKGPEIHPFTVGVTLLGF